MQVQRALRPLIAFAALAAAASAVRPADKITWKQYETMATFRIDDRPVASWNLFHPGKKEDPLLLQVGERFLLIEIRERQIFDLDAKKIERHGNELVWRENDKPAKPLDASAWNVRDVGTARRIRFQLEGRLFDLQTPEILDWR